MPDIAPGPKLRAIPGGRQVDPTAPNPFILLRGAGYSVVPITPPDAKLSDRSRIAPASRGKAVGVKGADGDWHGYDWLPYEAGELDCRRWHAMGAGVGVKTALAPAVDIDVTDASLAPMIITAIQKSLGTTVVRVGQAPKAVLLYRSPTPIPYMCLRFKAPDGVEHRVELLSRSRQVVMVGLHPRTRAPYELSCPLADLRLADRPEVTADAARAMLAQLSAMLVPFDCTILYTGETGDDGIAPDPATLEAPTVAAVAAAIKSMPNDGERFESRDAYISVGHAIKGALPSDPISAQELFVDWAMSWTGNAKNPHGNTAENALADWERMRPPYRIGWHWLEDQARSDPEFRNRLAAADFAAEAGQQDEPKPPPKSRYHQFPGDLDIGKIPLPRRLIGDWLERGHATVLVGKPGDNKTTLLLTLAVMAASGYSITGERVYATGKVIIATTEDAEPNIQRRVAAIAKQHGLDLKSFADNIIYTTASDGPLTLFTREAGPGGEAIPHPEPAWHELRKLVAEVRPVLIMLDPMIRLSLGLLEKINEAQSALVRYYSSLAGSFDCAVLLIHHIKKGSGESDDMDMVRGAGAIVGEVRAALHIRRLKLRTSLGQPMFAVAILKANYAPVGELYKLDQVLMRVGQTIDVVGTLECPPKTDSTVDVAVLTRASGSMAGVVEFQLSEDDARLFDLAVAALNTLPTKNERITKLAELVALPYGRSARQVRRSLADLAAQGPVRDGWKMTAKTLEGRGVVIGIDAADEDPIFD